jgi:polysaccharide pyruvyl transferase WcaK-like protein
VSGERCWPPGRPRILVTDAWLANAGDAAIAVATDALLRELAPEAAILHAAYHGAELSDRYPSLRLVPPLEDLLGTPWAPPAAGWEVDGPALVAGADLVVSQGGGFLVEAYEPRGRVAALADVVTRGRPVVLLGQTVGAFHGAALRHDLGVVLRTSPLVVVRDAASQRHATDLGARDPVLGSDLALLLPPAERTAGRAGVGVVLTAHHPEPGRRDDQRRTALDLLARVAAALPDEAIVAFSTVQGLPDLARDDDAAVARTARDALPPDLAARIEVVDGHLDALEVVERVGSLRALATMRLHPALLAARAGTPFALILGGQRAGVLDDTALAVQVAAPGDTDAIQHVLDRALASDAAVPAGGLSPLTERLALVRGRLGRVLEAVT